MTKTLQPFGVGGFLRFTTIRRQDPPPLSADPKESRICRDYMTVLLRCCPFRSALSIPGKSPPPKRGTSLCFVRLLVIPQVEPQVHGFGQSQRVPMCVGELALLLPLA